MASAADSSRLGSRARAAGGDHAATTPATRVATLALRLWPVRLRRRCSEREASRSGCRWRPRGRASRHTRPSRCVRDTSMTRPGERPRRLARQDRCVARRRRFRRRGGGRRRGGAARRCSTLAPPPTRGGLGVGGGELERKGAPLPDARQAARECRGPRRRGRRQRLVHRETARNPNPAAGTEPFCELAGCHG